ncbi:hypothetical protein NLU13_4003 [Sarocladium strictum]|uniref:ferric-chelate reductase (NADPH) n=1 Tax=Sarocladium strictum TaxID=5046 RepID=A0AA39GI31_SARSR|nr:hypothetical protein NLU13_4003 [Sarocladium strictum]
MASWLTAPVQLTGSRAFSCDGFTEEQCKYYMHRWHFWYIADHVYALPTVAFFMCAIGLFIFGNVVSRLSDLSRSNRSSAIWRRGIASVRYLSYRGFQVKALRWNSAPLGLLLLGLAGAVYFFCMTLIPQPYYWSSLDFGGSPPLGTRSGWMALACMPFVFATASKANWITLLTGVSHEKLQVFHRWSAYAFFLLALLHTFPFIVYHVRFHNMEMQWKMNNLFYWTGIVALLFQAWLTFASHSVFRKHGYEFFKMTHYLAVVVFVLVFFFHCDYTLTSWHYFIATAAVYVPCFAFSWLRTIFEYGLTKKAHLHVEDNGFTRITIPVENQTWIPGQHCFLRFTSFGLQRMSSHPFTICSLPPPAHDRNAKAELIFYIRHQGGLTEGLHNHALNHPDVPVPVMVDGPYGGINMPKFAKADRTLVIAGGSGAGWVLPFVELFPRREALLAQQDETGVAMQQQDDKPQNKTNSDSSDLETPLKTEVPLFKVIIATRETSSRVWFQQAVAKTLSKSVSSGRANTAGKFHVYVTGEADQEADIAASIPVPGIREPKADGVLDTRRSLPQMEPLHHGRPDLPSMIHEEATRAMEAGESLSVFVCGPDSMLQDVRNAVAAENLRVVKGRGSGEVYLHTEHFSWA